MIGLDKYILLTVAIKILKGDFIVNLPKEIAVFGLFELYRIATNGKPLFNTMENLISNINFSDMIP